MAARVRPGRVRRPVTWRDVGFSLCAGLLLAWAAYGAWGHARALRSGDVVSGTVAAYATTGREPVVTLRFTDRAGTRVECVTDDFAGRPRAGQSVRVRYDRSDPRGNCAIAAGGGGAAYAGFGVATALAVLLLGNAVRLLVRIVGRRA